MAAGPGPARGACGVGQAAMAPSPWRTASGFVAAASDQAVADLEEDPVYAARGSPLTPADWGTGQQGHRPGPGLEDPCAQRGTSCLMPRAHAARPNG